MRCGGTYSWGSTQINKHFGLLQEVILFVQLDKLEGSTGSIALFLCELVPFVETAFAVL
jgi:hypothetical protein